MSDPDLIHENYIEGDAIGQALTTVFALGLVIGLILGALGAAWLS